MTNEEILVLISENFPDNHSNLISPADLREVAEAITARQSIIVEMDFVAGPNDVTHSFGDIPSHVTFWQYLEDQEKTVLVSITDVYAEDATKQAKIIVTVPNDMPGMKIKLTP